MKSISGLDITQLNNTTSPKNYPVYLKIFYYIMNQKLIYGTSMLTYMLVIMIKLLFNRIIMSSLTRNPHISQINQLQLPNEPNIHSVK